MPQSNDSVEVPLSQGKIAIIDAADAEHVLQYKWHAWRKKPGHSWYALHNFRDSSGKKRPILLHRYLLNPPDGIVIDHRNGDGLDCRRQNMRLAPGAGNQRNCAKKGKINPYKGVSYNAERSDRTNARTKPWLAKICYDYRTINLGRYLTAEEAARAYDSAARELFGEFARLNFPDD